MTTTTDQATEAVGRVEIAWSEVTGGYVIHTWGYGAGPVTMQPQSDGTVVTEARSLAEKLGIDPDAVEIPAELATTTRDDTDDTEAFMDALEADGIAFEAATRLDLATAPAADIIADNHRRNAAEPMPLKTTADMFEYAAEWAINNVPVDDKHRVGDLFTDMVAALAPHLTAEVSAMYWEDLKEAIDQHNKAQDGEHPGDTDPLRWAEQCRAAVDYYAEMLAGVA